MIRTTTTLAAFGALALLAGQSGIASAAVYDPASAYVEQFTGAKGHIDIIDRSVSNPDQDYIDGLRSTFRAQERRAGEPDNWGQGQSNRVN